MDSFQNEIRILSFFPTSWIFSDESTVQSVWRTCCRISLWSVYMWRLQGESRYESNFCLKLSLGHKRFLLDCGNQQIAYFHFEWFISFQICLNAFNVGRRHSTFIVSFYSHAKTFESWYNLTIARYFFLTTVKLSYIVNEKATWRGSWSAFLKRRKYCKNSNNFTGLVGSREEKCLLT